MRLVRWAIGVVLALSACTATPPTALAPSSSLTPSASPAASATITRTAGPTPAPTPSRPTPVPGTPGPASGLAVVNAGASDGGLLVRFRVAFPQRYTATTQSDMTSYQNQGGTCCPPPSVVLTVGPQ